MTRLSPGQFRSLTRPDTVMRELCRANYGDPSAIAEDPSMPPLVRVAASLLSAASKCVRPDTGSIDGGGVRAAEIVFNRLGGMPTQRLDVRRAPDRTPEELRASLAAMLQRNPSLASVIMPHVSMLPGAATDQASDIVGESELTQDSSNVASVNATDDDRKTSDDGGEAPQRDACGGGESPSIFQPSGEVTTLPLVEAALAGEIKSEMDAHARQMVREIAASRAVERLKVKRKTVAIAAANARARERGEPKRKYERSGAFEGQWAQQLARESPEARERRLARNRAKDAERRARKGAAKRAGENPPTSEPFREG